MKRVIASYSFDKFMLDRFDKERRDEIVKEQVCKTLTKTLVDHFQITEETDTGSQRGKGELVLYVADEESFLKSIKELRKLGNKIPMSAEQKREYETIIHNLTK